MGDVKQLLQAFKRADKDGKGKIGRFQLAEVFQELDEYEWTPDDLNELFDSVDEKDTGFVKYNKFVHWVMEDDNGQVAGAVETEHEDTDDEDDHTARLEADPGCAEHNLDLTQIITEHQFLMIMHRLGEDAEEAKEEYKNLMKELADDGMSTGAGIPLMEILDHLNIDPEDRDSLHHMKKVLAEVLEKEAKGEEDPVAERRLLAPAAESVVAFLEYKGLPFEKAWEAVGKCHMSKLGRLELQKYESKQDELVKLIKKTADDPPVLPAHAGQTAAREHCVEMVEQIIKECKASGTKYTDPKWDVQKEASAVLYVDKERPGYDCTVGKPAAFKRLSEIVKDPVLFKGGVRSGDIIQGQIGTCFLLGAIGAIVSNNPKSIRRAFYKYDVDVGVYGIRLCLEGVWIVVVVDDYVPVDQYGRILYASSKDKSELWVTLLEKAYCKMYRCYEMCDGGLSNLAIYSLCGGGGGKLLISKKHRANPATYFKALQAARQHGWLLTTTFVVRRGAARGQGKCGEAVLPGGLVGGHVYSVLRVVEAGGEMLVCCRNPWGTGEWSGKWSDEDGAWTDELKKACGWTDAKDGTFWMSIQDFVANSGGVMYARTFGPPWKKLTQYRHFVMGALEAEAQWAYKAAADDEVGFDKGQVIEVDTFSSGWWYGNVMGDAKKGFFPGNYVKLKKRPVSRFDLEGTVDEGCTDMTALVILVQGNVLRDRNFTKRKQDGLNYKVTKFPRLQIVVVGPDGKVAMQKTGCKSALSGELTLPGGGNWRIYCIALDGVGGRFSLRTYIKDGKASLKEVPNATLDEVTTAMAAR